jgi:hypothetical protein
MNAIEVEILRSLLKEHARIRMLLEHLVVPDKTFEHGPPCPGCDVDAAWKRAQAIISLRRGSQ